MSRGERPDVPNWALIGAEKLQKIPGSVVRGMERALAGSSYPYYRQLRWQTAAELVDPSGRPAELPYALGDPDAGPEVILSRFKKKAAVVAVGKLSLHELLDGYEEAEPAVAYTYKHKTHVGMLPDGLLELGNEDSRYYWAAFRSGRNDFDAGIVAWIENKSMAIRPDLLEVKYNNVPLGHLQHYSPGIPLF